MNLTQAPPASAPDAPHPASELAELLGSIFASIWRLLGSNVPLLGRFVAPLQNRFSRARTRISAILTKLAAGTWRPARKRAPRPGQKGGPNPPYTPRGNLWLVRKLGYHAAGYGAQLTHYLNRPETLALLASAPSEAKAALGRTLRPLAKLLGTDLPADFLPAPHLRQEPEPGPAKRRKPPTPPKPRPEPHRHPIYPQKKPRFLLDFPIRRKPYPA